MSEEEISSKILLPFLRDLGFDIKEISLENRYVVSTDRYTHMNDKLKIEAINTLASLRINDATR